MSPEEILSHPPRVLTQAQREHYFEHGYVLVASLIAREWIERLRAAVDELVEGSRSLTDSDGPYDLEPGHTTEAPRLRRITNPAWLHPVIWEYVSESILADLVADLVGPDVKFLDTMMNFKWACGGSEIKWHQDVPFSPHTNDAVLTTGTYIEDVGLDQGAMGVISGSHTGEYFDHYGRDGRWSGSIADEDLARVDLDRAVYLTGPAGTVQAHNASTIHGSARNDSERGRPILLSTYAAADAYCYVPYPTPTPHTNTLVRGTPTRIAHLDARPRPVPPDWSKGKGYQSIFTWQQKERAVDEGRAPDAS